MGLLTTLLMVFSLAGIQEVTAQEQGSIVILSSDNEADLTLAQKVAGVINATLVVTKWGVYNESVLEEILNMSPDLVIIIGGPVAVPRMYYDMLKDFNITVLWANGVDRADTCRKVFEILQDRFPKILENVTIVVVHGWDYPALMEAMKEKGIVPLIVKNATVDIGKFRKIKIIRSRYAEKIMERLRERLGNRTIEVNVNVTAEMAERAIKIAEERVEIAKELVQNSTLPNAKILLKNAEEKLRLAKEKYEEGKYGAAFGLATASKSIAEIIIRSATENVQKKINRETIRLRIELRILERVLNRLKAKGIDVSLEEKLLKEAKVALDHGNIRVAKILIIGIHKELRRIIREFHERGGRR